MTDTTKNQEKEPQLQASQKDSAENATDFSFTYSGNIPAILKHLNISLKNT